MNACLINHSLENILLSSPVVPTDPIMPPNPNDIIDSKATIIPCPNADVEDGFLSLSISSKVYPIAPAEKKILDDIANEVSAADDDAVADSANTGPR